MLKNYENANLIPLLESIRKAGRYAGHNGVNALTNIAQNYNKAEVIRELHRAVAAGEKKERNFSPEFTDPNQGLSYGLNPYTDWSLAQLEAPPSHYYLFLGLDFYSISALGHTDRWFDYLANPFWEDEKNKMDKYWHNVWAWILRKFKTGPTGKISWQTPISERDAAAFIRMDGGGFVFHNLLPYLRPAGFDSSGINWAELEWKKESVRKDVIDDLRVLRRQTGGQIIAFCTSQNSVKALREAGYDHRRIISWKSHPSNYFYPKKFIENELWFQGKLDL